MADDHVPGDAAASIAASGRLESQSAFAAAGDPSPVASAEAAATESKAAAGADAPAVAEVATPKASLIAGVSMTAHGALKHPLYCQSYLQHSFQNNFCEGTSTCSCSFHCTTTAHAAWGWDPGCCACNGVALDDGTVDSAQAVLLVVATLAESKLATGLDHPAFCQELKSGTSSPYCRAGATTCSCQDHCPRTPPASHEWDPDCCACAGADGSVVTSSVLAMEVKRLSHPAFCVGLKEGTDKVPLCRGDSTCTCSFQCTTMDPRMHAYDAACCGCDSAAMLH